MLTYFFGGNADELLEEFGENKKEINDTLTNVEWNVSVRGWGGDSERGLDSNEYSPEEIRYYLNIDKKEPITQEVKQRMVEYAMDCTCEDEISYVYSNGKEDYSFERNLE